MQYKMDEMNFYENLALAMEKERVAMGLTQEEMAEAIDLSFGAYKKIARRETYKIPAYSLYKLHNLTGKFGRELTGYGSENTEIIAKLRPLSKSQVDFVDSILDFELNFVRTLPKDTNVDDYISVLVLTGDMEDGMIYDSSNIKKVYAKDYIEKLKPHVINSGIEVSSNHLHPVYHMGEIILICKEPIRNGDTGVFINKNTSRAYLRKYVEHEDYVMLTPVCDYGEPFKVSKKNNAEINQWIKYGKVLSKMR